jgi:hypothetical protein
MLHDFISFRKTCFYDCAKIMNLLKKHNIKSHSSNVYSRKKMVSRIKIRTSPRWSKPVARVHLPAKTNYTPAD